MIKFSVNSIRTQIIIMLLLSMGVVFLLLSYVTSERLSVLPDIVLEQYQETADAKANELANELQGMHYQIEMIALSNTLQSQNLEEIQQYLTSIAKQNRFRNFTYATPDGIAWTTYDLFIDISEQEQFDQIFNYNQRYFVSKPFYSPFVIENIPIITMSHAIRNPFNQTIGLVNGVVSTSFIDDLVDSITFKELGYAWIVDEEGMIISHPEASVTIDNSFNQLTDEQNEVLLEDAGSFSYTINNQKMLSIYSTIDHTPGWKFILSIDYQHAFQEVYDVMSIVNYSLIVALIILIIILLYATHTITTPILKLKHVFEEASKGNMNVIADESIPNELGEAGKSFNKMLTQIKELTYIDPITGLKNFFSFLNEMPRLSESFFNQEGTCYVAILSIDDFKKINSLYGYDIGNEVLREFTHRIQPYLKENELIARYFGDEMIFSMFSFDEQEIQDRIYEIVQVAQQTIVIANIEVNLDVSCGVATFEPFKSMEDVIRQATIAKHKAKSDDVNHVYFYNQSIYQEMKHMQTLEAALQDALDLEQLYLLYQPIYNITQNRIIGYEALLRWNHPEYSSIPIIDVIKLAESKGLIVPIGQFVFTEAILKLKQLNKVNPSLFVSINVSALQLQSNQFVDFVTQRLLVIPVNPKNITIEITESATMLDVSEKGVLLSKLKDLGLSVSIDDFGTGYSSLIYISQLPINTIKIDKEFVQKIEYDDYSKALIASILSIGKTLHLSVIAEGVETKEQMDALYELGCEIIQGFYISKPIKL